MLSKQIIELLNNQVEKEMYASNLYLNMSSWCYNNGLDGAGRFLYDHATEERDHAMRLVRYLNETDSKMKLSEIKAPPSDFNGLKDVFEKTYKHELEVTASINNLAEQALNNKDFSTFNFLQWYVNEQHEEEALFKNILDKINIIGDGANGTYLADQYIGSAGKKSS